MIVKNQNNTPVVVLGSKPNPSFPDEQVEVVFAANGSVEAALVYREKYGSKIIGLVPSIELRKHKHIQDSVIKSSPDQMVVFGNDTDIVSFIHKDLGLSDVDVVLLSNIERRSLMVSLLGWRMLPISLCRIRVRGIKHFLRKILPDILLNREKDWLTHSTGLDSIMYAMKIFPDRDIIAVGIGLKQGAHMNGVGEFMYKTSIADRDTMKHWPLSRRKRVYTTDDIMHNLGKVPLWKGDTF